MNKNQSVALKAKLKRNGFIELKLRGRCMEPFLVAGDSARIFPAEEIGVGDICLLRLESGECALHRVVAQRGNTVFTKGDYSGLIERCCIRDVIGCAHSFRFGDSSGWFDYARHTLIKRFSAWLSRNIVHDNKKYCLPIWRKICKKAIWIEGSLVRSSARRRQDR